MPNGLMPGLRSFPAGKFKSSLSLFLIVCAVLLAPSVHADDLHYFKNYFVTGDYAVAGVGLYGQGKSGVATGTINMTAVPAGADIVAAFLYWQTVEVGPTTSSPAAIKGTFVSNGANNAIVGDVLGAGPAPACWTPSGTAAPTATAITRTYRADVLRYLPINTASNIRVADGTFKIELPDSGTGAITATIPHTYGATLVVVYRLLPVDTAPYKAVVIYDGASTMTRSSAPFAQNIGGFYQALGLVGAKMTQIVGNGQPNFDETLTVNGNVPLGLTNDVFVGAQGSHWDNPTFNITLPLSASSVQTQVNGQGSQVCLSWAAVVTSTIVVNTDDDGILDTWKVNGLHLNIGSVGNTSTNTPAVPATFGGCAQYPSDPCENFPKMGAVLGTLLKPHPDIFVQIDWMSGTDASGYSHIHVPKLAALQMIANTFATHKISVHFDVGSHYQQSPALSYIVPSAYAKGGNVIPEAPLECPNSQVTSASNCSFDSQQLGYSALGWKVGFDAVANGFPVLGLKPIFPHDRKDTFHYILFGHALAGPFPVPNPAVPSSVSGVADTPGGDLLVTLGLWRTDNPPGCIQDDPTGANSNICTDETGTTIVQAGTMMHELGHNMGLYHGGTVNVPNCMPDYPSVMNYLYQTRGLTDAAGNEHIDFSYGLLGPLNENSLSETKSLGTLMYRMRYYALPNSTETASVAKAHCDGTPLNGTNEVRLETPGLTVPDWNNDGKVDADSSPVDINFNGTAGNSVNDSVQPSVSSSNPNKQWFVDHNDWSNLNLQQIGGRMDVNGLSDDISASDLGQSDLGQSDLGQSDLGQSDLGQSDLGQSDLGQSDLGQSDLGDVNYDTAISTLDATGSTTPLVATVSASTGTAYNQIRLTWGLPSLGQIRTYTIYRTNLSAATLVTEIAGTVSGTPPATAFIDPVTDGNLSDIGAKCPATSVCYDANYQYYVIATDSNNTASNPSNFVTATVDHLFVSAYTGTVVYGNTLPNYSATASTISGLPSGGIANTAYTCTNTIPTGTPRNVASYTITCTGGPVAVGTGSVYGVTYLPGTLMITTRPLTIAAQSNTKVYDGTTTAATSPTVVATVTNVSGLVNGDTVTGLVETYNTASAGNSKTLGVTPTYTVNDQNGGGNYLVTLTTASGVITPFPMTITASAVNKVYDGGTVASVTLSDNRIPNAGDTFTDSYASATFASKNVGTAIAINVTGININGTGTGNYTFNTTATTSANITPAPLTLTVTGTQVYGGTGVTFFPAFSGFVNGESPSIVTGTLSCTTSATATTPVGNSSKISACSGLTAPNYKITCVYGAFTVTPAPLSVTVAGMQVYGGTGITYLPVYSGLVNLEPPSVLTGALLCTTNATSSSPVGSGYTILCSGLSDANYTISYFYGPFSVTAAPLTATVTGTQVYGGTGITFTPAYSTFVGSDTSAVVSGTLTCSTNATNSSPVGNSYTVSNCSGLSATNYNISYTYGAFSVTPAPLTAIIGESSDMPPVFSATFAGFVNSDDSTIVTGTLACTVDATADTAGNFPISCLGLNAPNYIITYSFSPVSVSVSPAPLTIAVSGTMPLGGTPTFTVTYSGFLGTDLPSIVTGTLSCTLGPGPTALADKITACSGLSVPDPTVYTIYYWLGTVKITPKL